MNKVIHYNNPKKSIFTYKNKYYIVTDYHNFSFYEVTYDEIYPILIHEDTRINNGFYDRISYERRDTLERFNKNFKKWLLKQKICNLYK